MTKKILTKDLNVVIKDIDVFINCSSFESRCRTIAETINKDRIKYAIIGENKNLTDYVGENANYLRSLFGDKTIDTPLDTSDPILSADSIIESLQILNTNDWLNILVDISTFTHEQLIILTRLIFDYSDKHRFYMVYTGADYCPNTERIEDIWLSKGVSEVRSILGYPGEILPSNKTHLVILVGYEHERATKLIESFEPDIISLGHGKKGSETSEKEGGANKYFKDLVEKIAFTYGNTKDFEFLCNDPWGTSSELNNIIINSEEVNNIIAPMNTKLSSLGCVMTAIKNDSVQLCYSQALQYNYYNYSTPRDYCYILNFEDLFK